MSACPHRRTYRGLDVGNVLFKGCADCGSTWVHGVIDPEKAAVVRTALALGRTWETAWRIADRYERTYVDRADRPDSEGGRYRSRSRSRG